MKHEQYHFRSHWQIEAGSDEVWAVLALPHLWHVWWPDLKTVHVLEEQKNLEGTLLVGIWRSLVGYRLHVVFDIEKVKEGEEILLKVSGDITGYLLVQLQPKSKNKTVVRFTWDIKTVKPWMNKLAPMLKKFITKNQALIMARGEKGLTKYLKTHQDKHVE